MSENGRTSGVGQGEALAVWALWAAVAVAVVVTYARVPVEELYHVSETGLVGGLGRALVLVDFPIALVGIALALVAMDALPAAAGWIGALAIVLCAAVAVPGTVDQDDLDARPINAIPAVGVAIALTLTIVAARRAGVRPTLVERGDALRLAAVAALVALSLPWVAADLGFHVPGDLFLGEEPTPEPDGTVLAAVHLGHHHGFDGALLAVTAIVLSRVPVAGKWLRHAVALYLALMLAYGLVNAAQDLWLEQVVKRGWADTRIPDALRPQLTPIWIVILALAALAYAGVTSRPSRTRPSTKHATFGPP